MIINEIIKVLNLKMKIILIIIITLFYFGCEDIYSVNLKDVEIKNVKDGIYYGEFNNTRIKVRSRVEVSGNRIENIKLLEYKHHSAIPPDNVTRDIVVKQSLQVDMMTQATDSRKAIIKSVENALKKGL